MYSYDNDMASRTRLQKGIRHRRESNDKENKKEANTSFKANGRLRRQKHENIPKQDDRNSDDDNEESLSKADNIKIENKDEKKVNGEQSML